MPTLLLLPPIALLAALLGGYATSRQPAVIAVAVLAFFLARREPLAGLALALGVAPFCGRAPGFFDPTVAGAAAVGLAWLLSGTHGEPLRVRFAAPIGWAVGLLAVAALSLGTEVAAALQAQGAGPRELLQDALNVTVAQPLYAVQSLYQLGIGVLVAALVATRADAGDARRLLGVLLIAHAVTLIVGVLDHAGVISLRALRPISGGIEASPFPHRLVSTFWHPSWYAQWLALMVPIAFGWGAASAGAARHAGCALGALTVVALPLTFQRGGWIAAAVGGGCVLAAWAHRAGGAALRAHAPGIAAYALVTLAAGTALSLSTGQASGVASRVTEVNVSGRERLWRGALRLAARHPVLGWGHNTFGWIYRREMPRTDPDFYGQHDTAHNGYLQMLTGCGLAGLLALLGLVGSTLLRALRALRGADAAAEPARIALLTAVAGALIAYLVDALVQELFYIHALALAFWTLIGLAVPLSAPLAATAPEAGP